MNKKICKLVIDVLNLVFGAGEENDIFWQELLLPECNEHFKVKEAIKYRSSHAADIAIDMTHSGAADDFEEHEDLYVTPEELFDRRKINHNALYFAIISRAGLDIDLSIEPKRIRVFGDKNE